MSDLTDALDNEPRKPNGKLTLTPDGAEVNNVVVQGELNGDWSKVFTLFNLDATEFVVADDTVRMTTWQQSKGQNDGTRSTVQLYSYSARFKRRSTQALDSKQVDSWRTALQKNAPKKPAKLPKKSSTYVVCVADPQLGKTGTKEAVKNWNRGVESHLVRAQRLGADAIHIAYMGDEIEQAQNHYCVGVNERILTKDMRWVTAGSLKLGDSLYGIEEQASSRACRQYEPSQVMHHSVENLPAVRVGFSDGTTLMCTPEHPLLVRPMRKHGYSPYRWVAAKDLMNPAFHKSHGRIPYLVMKPYEPWESDDSYDAGWMGGLLDGEGCYSKPPNRQSTGRLSFSQKPGPVLDKAKRILDSRGFRYSETGRDSGVHVINILGGLPEVHRALGTFRPVRLLKKITFPEAQSKKDVEVVSVDDIGVQPIAVMSTSSKTYFANGVASHNSSQLFNLELNLSDQLALDYDMRVWTTKKALETGLPLSVSSVISNHGEWTRNASRDPSTSHGDNASTFIARQVRSLFQELGEHGYPRIEWYIAGEDPSVVVNLSGVKVLFTHGYIEKGRGPSVEARTKNAMERQVLGNVDLSDVKLFVTAHYHHWWAVEESGRTFVGCPSLEAKGASQWIKDSQGVWSDPGMLGFLVENTARGWSEMDIR